MKKPNWLRPVLLVPVAVALLAAVSLGIAFAFTAASEREEAQHRAGSLYGEAAALDASKDLAVVDGVAITDADFALAEARVQGSRLYLNAELAAEGGAPNAKELLDLLDAFGDQTVAFAGVLVDAAMVAEAERRGLTPTEAEVNSLVEEQKVLVDSVRGGKVEILPESLARLNGLLEAVGEDTYWNKVAPAEAFSTLMEGRLREEVVASVPQAEAQAEWVRFRLELANRADVSISDPALAASVKLTDVLAYIQQFTRTAFDV